MRNPFEYAHARDDIAWMAQNTNHLPTHPLVKERLREIVDSGEYSKYPIAAGLDELKRLILEDLKLPEYDLHITNGGTEGLYCLMRYLLPEGSQMITSDPSYFIIHKFAKIGGAKTTDIPIYNDNFRYNINEVKEAITPETKAILLIDPLNPLGTTYPEEEIKELCDFARENDLWIVNDVTYRDFAPDHILTTEFYPEKTVVVYSVSKNCGLAGLRVGALVGTKDFIKDIRGHMSADLGINILGQHAAVAALETKNEWLPDMIKTCNLNQELIRDAVERVPGAYLPVYPSAATMMVIDIEKTGINGNDIQNELLYQHQIFIRAGDYVSTTFGEKFIRVSFSIPTDDVKRFNRYFPEVMKKLSK